MKKTKEVEKNVFHFWKNVSETSFQALNRFKTENPEHKDSKLCFAGRLDPMACGWIIILANNMVFKKDDYTSKDKIYEATVLIGASTDTDDVFGLIEKVDLKNIENSYKKIQDVLDKYIGKQEQQFSHFSSKHVEGKALFQWATEKRLDEIDIPTHEIEIYDIKVSNIFSICEKDYWFSEIKSRIEKIEGDFRTEEIINMWKETLEEWDKKMTHLEFTISAGSGTYVRQLIHDIGEEIKIPMTVFEIRRISIG
jgi:tRNA pseudouridine(55) synthase